MADFFHIFFWGGDDLKYFIIIAINGIFKKKQLPISQRLRLISCVANRDKPKNFGVFLMETYYTFNFFYKLVSGRISSGIKSTLDTLTANKRTAFIQRRFKGEILNLFMVSWIIQN